MALLERVATLVRANLNDLVDKAEDPEKMMKQIILDMENQLLQVKTQVAISIADQHVLEKKRKENEESEQQWKRRTEMAVDRGDDVLARAAIERSMSYRTTADSFQQQVEDQKSQVDTLRQALIRLQQKLEEARSKSDILIAQHRRARALGKANDAGRAIGDGSNAAAFGRMKNKIQHSESVAQASSELSQLLSDDVNGKFAAMEKEGEIDRQLAELKARRSGRLALPDGSQAE